MPLVGPKAAVVTGFALQAAVAASCDPLEVEPEPSGFGLPVRLAATLVVLVVIAILWAVWRRRPDELGEGRVVPEGSEGEPGVRAVACQEDDEASVYEVGGEGVSSLSPSPRGRGGRGRRHDKSNRHVGRIVDTQ